MLPSVLSTVVTAGTALAHREAADATGAGSKLIRSTGTVRILLRVTFTQIVSHHNRSDGLRFCSISKKVQRTSIIC